MINLKVLERMLTRLGVNHVKKCKDGTQAMDYLKSIGDDALSLPNVILSDLHMPNMGGYELVGHLRAVAQYEMPPMVMACTGE